VREIKINVVSLRVLNERFHFLTPSIGLHWKRLEGLLSPTFKWEAAVQKALGTEDSLQEVWRLVLCYSCVHIVGQRKAIFVYVQMMHRKIKCGRK